MTKIIFMIIAMSLLSGCRCYFSTGCSSNITKEYNEVLRKCDDKFMQEYQNDPSIHDPNKNWGPIRDAYFKKCMKENGDPTKYDWREYFNPFR